ncbi:MAG: hypothetical protein SGI96_21215 [Bacteroidota bacterium]|nr:hypothetical protein [Bacteroidota bacterium]
MPNRIQGSDFKTLAELGGSGNESKFIGDDQIFMTANSLNKTLKQAIIDGDMGVIANLAVINNSTPGNYSMAATASETQIYHTANISVIYQLPSAPGDTRTFSFYNGGINSTNLLNEVRIQPASGAIIRFRNQVVGFPGFVAVAKRGGSVTIINISPTVWVVTDASYQDHQKNTSIGTVRDISLVGRDTWISRAAMPVAQFALSSWIQNDFAYQSNNAVYQYNGSANTWATKTTQPNNPISNTMAYFLNGFGYSVGGFFAGARRSYNDQYNDATNAWTSRTGTITARNSGGGISLNGYGYVFNGFDPGGPISLAERYNDSANSWSAMAVTGTAKYSLVGFLLNGYGYGAVGAGPVSDHNQYNDSSNTWIGRKAYPLSLEAAGVFANNNYGYVLAGTTGTEVSSVYEYNDSSNTWSLKSPVDAAYDGQGMGFAVGGFGYRSGGRDGVARSSVQQYN